jgi:hypothetical protein
MCFVKDETVWNWKVLDDPHLNLGGPSDGVAVDKAEKGQAS